ncbi:MAG: glycerophosphoryl diester phosphodiesterase [Solirubrobacterales bacterium]|nr:glycerophosphoryl diester phosphodiesterase [Solirubrobacterales bacterium]
MLEFDVRRLGRRFILAHSPWDGWRRGHVLGLERALWHLSQPRFAALEFNVDLKAGGGEAAVVAALARHGLLERCLFSSQHAHALDRVRRAAPRARVALSVGGRVSRLRHHTWRRRSTLEWAEAQVARGRFDGLMLQHRLVQPELVQRLRALRAEVYAWTVDDRSIIERLVDLGVTGVTTNDLRLFARASVLGAGA